MKVSLARFVDGEEVMCNGTSRRREGHGADMAGIKLGAAWKIETNARKPWERNGKRAS